MERLDLLQGTLHLLVLKTLSQGPLNGHALANRIKLITEDALHPGEGTLYPALYRMERRGWVRSKWGLSENNRKARYYKLTSAGRRQLELESKAWADISEAIAKIMQTA
ncbi:MAG TPA: PadR family transcriptional regulator [Pyrinomonadaceae bacterium]|nr:PadR family transcriptional regulator [Pyrinomonadaceae bacterium]